MNKNIKVSIIVPVFNGILYLEKCMKSILNQTYKNIEVILSDDGSSDGSLEIMKKYAKKYDFIKYESHENVGLSDTRNRAFKLVTGDYVTYLDVDDYLDNDFILKLLETNHNNDIVIGGYRRVYEDGKVKFEYGLKDTEWNRYRRVTVWAKLYKVSFLKRNKITFPSERLFGEDVVYTMKCMSKTNNIIITEYIGYNNLINANSITHKDKHKILNDVPKMLYYIDDFIGKDNEYLTLKKDIVYYYMIKIFTSYLIEQSEFLSLDELYEYYCTSFGMIKDIFKKYKYKIHFCLQRDEPIKVNLIINIFTACEKTYTVKILLRLLNLCYYQRQLERK